MSRQVRLIRGLSPEEASCVGSKRMPSHHGPQPPVIDRMPSQLGILADVYTAQPAQKVGSPTHRIHTEDTSDGSLEAKECTRQGSTAHPLAPACTSFPPQRSGAGCQQRKEAQCNGKGAALEQSESTQTRTQVSSTPVCSLSLCTWCVARGRAAPLRRPAQQ